MSKSFEKGTGKTRTPRTDGRRATGARKGSGKWEQFAAAVRKKAEEIAKQHDIELFDVTFRPERDDMILRIVVDRPGISLDECALVSRGVSEWLDERAEEIPFDQYNLEVSTPGIDRPLRTEADFNRYAGKLCRIETRTKDESGRKRYNGRIESAENGKVVIFAETESQFFTITIQDIAKARLELEL